MLPTFAEDPIKGIESSLLEDALSARKRWLGAVRNDRYVTIIDFGKRSNEKRFYLLDLQTRQAQSFLVAHGKGTDPDHDGQADVFSNAPDSKMTSLGAFVTGDIYYGRHGLSLKLHGLEPSNDLAEARAIVIHGADYVSSSRPVLGRSWGCPALSRDAAQHVIPLIKDGAFVFAVARSTE